MDMLLNGITNLNTVKKIAYSPFTIGLIVIFYFYFYNKSSSTSTPTSTKSNSRLILIMVIAYYFRNDIMKILNFKNNSKKIRQYESENNENVIYKYGTNHVEGSHNTHFFDRNLNQIWKKIKKFKKKSPLLVKDIYYHLQHYQNEIKQLNTKDGYIHQHFDKLIDRKDEIMNILESLEYTENIEMKKLKEEVRSFLVKTLHEAKRSMKTDRINSSNGTVVVDDIDYAIN
jgi:hypothetical protein